MARGTEVCKSDGVFWKCGKQYPRAVAGGVRMDKDHATILAGLSRLWPGVDFSDVENFALQEVMQEHEEQEGVLDYDDNFEDRKLPADCWDSEWALHKQRGPWEPSHAPVTRRGASQH